MSTNGMSENEEVCHYCGKPLSLYHDDKPARRKDVDGWHKLHKACASNWDAEGKRL